MKRYLSFLLYIMLSIPALAQSNVEMADNFRSEGKIYVVVAVILTILIGLFIYLIRLDRKISRLKNDENQGV